MNSHLVFLSLENWDDIWRRNQFICAELAKRSPQSKILFVAPPRDFSNAIRNGKWRSVSVRASWSPEELPNIQVYRPLKLLPNSLSFGRKLNAAFFCRQVRGKIQELQLDRFILWINDHSAVQLLGKLNETASVYDITDDWITFDQPKHLANRIAAQDRRLCENCDAVIVCSEHLYRIKEPLVQSVERLHLIPNGVDADHYASVSDGSMSINQLADLPKPVLGYVGTIHPDRVDIALLENLALRLQDGCIALVGPNFLSREAMRKLENTGKIYFTGPVAYADVPSYMRAFDICITPHRVTPFTESLNPIKLWEYLASGKPIVSTNVAGFRDFPKLTYIANDCESFLALLKEARTEPSELSAKRKEESRRHSWTSRVDEVEQILCQLAKVQ